MRNCDVVVLSKYPEIFAGFKESVDADAPELSKMVVWDCHGGHDDPRCINDPQWSASFVNLKFKMAFNGNIALRGKNDVLYCGDDVRLIEPNTIKRLQELAYSDPEIGILSPKIIGHAQEWQMRPTASPITFAPWLAFVFVYIKRSVIEKVGYLDERFEGYGADDLEYCFRARRAGFKLGVASDINVKHGFGKDIYGSTFKRTRGEDQMAKDDRANWTRFAEKYGIADDMKTIMEFLTNG
jgi:hypothetical protein